MYYELRDVTAYVDDAGCTTRLMMRLIVAVMLLLHWRSHGRHGKGGGGSSARRKRHGGAAKSQKPPTDDGLTAKQRRKVVSKAIISSSSSSGSEDEDQLVHLLVDLCGSFFLCSRPNSCRSVCLLSLATPEGRKAELTLVFVGYIQDGLPVRRQSPIPIVTWLGVSQTRSFLIISSTSLSHSTQKHIKWNTELCHAYWLNTVNVNEQSIFWACLVSVGISSDHLLWHLPISYCCCM